MDTNSKGLKRFFCLAQRPKRTNGTMWDYVTSWWRRS